MEQGTKVIVTEKDGSTAEGSFVSSKAGWTVVMLKDGTEKKYRNKDVAEKLTKAEQKRREREAAKAEKEAAKAAEGETGAEGSEKLLNPDLSRYVLHDTVTASGRKQIDIDDDVAKILREKTLEEVYSYTAKLCEVTIKSLKERYETLNPGMQRMNLGNKVRAAMRAAAKASEEVSEMKGNKAPAKKVAAKKTAPKKEKAAKPAPKSFVTDAGAAVPAAAAQP
jgi:hypothetical protein